MSGNETVEATLAIITKESTLKQRLQKSVAFGGDVDTVAALSLALSSLDDTVVKDLPPFLTEGLENETFGRDYILKLDKDLADF